MSPDALALAEVNVLPHSWTWASLGQLGLWTGGGTPSKSVSAYWVNGSIPWVSPKDMKAEIIRDTEDHITEAAVAGSATKFVPAGSVLMVMRSGILRHTFPVAVNADRVTVNQDLRALIPAEGIDPSYIAHYLRGIQRQVLHRCSKDGTTVQSIEVSALERIRVPIAPAAEQRRIVARIDELFTEIAEGEAALQRARQGLDTWRRALLKAAVTGELTCDWREANRPAETGADLLARIRADRGASGSGHFRKRRGATDLPLDTSDLPALPDGWVWARLSELGTFGRGKSKHRPRDDPRLYGGDVPFVQTGIVAGAGDYIKGFYQTYSELGVAQSHIWPAGTLCITIAANIAKTALLAFEACFPDSVVGLFPHRGVDAYFIHMWMKTIQSRLEAFAPATAQKNINLEVLHNVAVPLPSTEEQLQIVDRFRGALDAVSDCVETVELDKDRDALRQSILKAAFEGRLVPQDPTDAPASELLARLRNSDSGNGARWRRARAAANFSYPSLPGLIRQSVDPRVEPAGDE